MLYFRMFLTMGVSLYTSRVILNTLGVSDFGIYNVVGGVVMMLSFLNASMSSATQRFLSFELGKQDYDQLKKVFGMSVNIHIIIAIAIFFLAETVGLWFLNAKLNIPETRMGAANWVYQFSIFSFMVSIVSVPYNATIIAHEKMNFYAYVSILEVILKLLIVFALVWFGFDKLKLYALLVFMVSVTIRIVYQLYSRKHFAETKYKFFWENDLFKTLFSYAGWNLFGNIASVLYNQGINILLNIFFGPVVNAANGIAYQVNGAVTGFVSNFQISMNPQIVKSYASNDQKYMQQLIFQGAKFSFYLLLLLSLPIILEADMLLKWWLKNVPESAVIFCKLVLINSTISCLTGPISTAVQATGRIKKYQSIVGSILLLNIPLTYLFIKIGGPPQTALIVSIALTITALFIRIQILSTLMSFSAKQFLEQVIMNVIFVSGAAVCIPIIILMNIEKGIPQFIIVSITSLISVVACIYIIGLNKSEKEFLKVRLMNVVKRIKYRRP